MAAADRLPIDRKQHKAHAGCDQRRHAIEIAGACPDLWLLTHPDLRQVQRLRVFSDYLVECLRSDPRLQ